MAKLNMQRSMTAIASIALVTLVGIASPVHAKPDCDANPDAAVCGGEKPPKPTPKPQVKPSPIVQQVLARSGQIEQVAATAWSQFGKGILAQQIKDELDGKRVTKILGKSVRLKNIAVNLRDLTVKEVTVGATPDQIKVKLVAPGNNVNAMASVPLSPDPSFRVSFDLELEMILTVKNSSNPITVDAFTARSVNADVSASNLAGGIMKPFLELFTGGDFSRNITNRANQSISKDDLSAKIQAISNQFNLFAGLF